MEFQFHKKLEKRKSADALIVPMWIGEQKKAISALSLPPSLIALLQPVLESGDFKGAEGEVLCLYTIQEPEKRIFLLGLGLQDKSSPETLRRAYGSVTKSALAKKIKSLNVLVPFLDDNLVRGLMEGILLPNYAIDLYKTPDPEDSEGSRIIQKINWIGSHTNIVKLAEKTLTISEAVYYARDLVNGNSDDITPQYLESCARGLTKEYPKIKATLFNKARIEKEKLGLLLAVNRGSARDPAFIILEYKNNSKSKDHTVLIGKGITFDTGGINLKMTGSGLELMKCDMGGAAACLGIVSLAAALELKINLTVVIPSTENCIDAKSYKPGEVYTSYGGKTVEIGNTDAEGRLILADAMAYAVTNLHPTRLIDLATLTGGMDIALGSEASGLMSNNNDLAEALLLSGEATFERLWRMPLYDEYKERLRSDIADLKSWNGRSAGPCFAATFLKEFTNGVPWAHCDIASTAYLLEGKKYLPKYASGVGVRLIIDFLERLQT